MDPYSSGEDPVIKTRKPYTITKQRERWTEDEHNRFLEALKLYGRAWQRIEEHLGTKTAVQIRSHAQKFFTKLEKEAIVKGVPIGQSLDIEIPPPRPKRKPNIPYPRKTGLATPASHVEVKDGKISATVPFSSCQSKVTVATEKEPKKPCDYAKSGNSDMDNHSEAFTPVKEAPCESPSSAYKIASTSDAPENSCAFREYAPVSRETMNQDETAASQVTTEAKGYQLEKSDTEQPCQDNLLQVHSKKINELKQSENGEIADVQASQSYPCHVPLHMLDGSLGIRAFNISPEISHGGSVFRQMGVNQESSVHQSFPSYHPAFSPIQSQDDCQSSLHVSTPFSSLIVSALSQNPAAYAAASLAAVMLPSQNMEPSVEPSRPLSTNPSMAAIAAATVAAATAWWEAHGLLPFSHHAFTCSPASPSATPMACSQYKAGNSERSKTSHDPASVGMNLNAALANPETAKVEVTAAELHVADKSTNKNPMDRSSCGSNTSSSSEVEADALEKHVEEKEEKEEQEEVDPMHLPSDPFGRRYRSTSNGQLAFDALFSREKLPQSFLPHKGKTWSMCSSLISGSVEDGVLNLGPEVGQCKVKANHRTGFKPYKRCPVEAKDEEKCGKRLRLEGESST